MLSNGKRKHCSFFVCLGFMTGSFVFGFQVRGDEVLTERGRTLFEKSNWNRRSRGFNAHSCAVCHHLGGVGGAGEEAFNARSIGIEKLRVPAKTTTARLATFLRRFHPQFVDPNETVTT